MITIYSYPFEPINFSLMLIQHIYIIIPFQPSYRQSCLSLLSCLPSSFLSLTFKSSLSLSLFLVALPLSHHVLLDVCIWHCFTEVSSGHLLAWAGETEGHGETHFGGIDCLREWDKTEAQRKRPFTSCPVSWWLCWLAEGLWAYWPGSAGEFIGARLLGWTRIVRLHGCRFQRHSCLHSLPILASVFLLQAGLFGLLESVVRSGEVGFVFTVHLHKRRSALSLWCWSLNPHAHAVHVWKGKFHDLINTDGSLKGLNCLWLLILELSLLSTEFPLTSLLLWVRWWEWGVCWCELLCILNWL